MNKAMRLIVTLIIVAVIVAGAVVIGKHHNKSASTTANSTTSSSTSSANADATITYDGSQFEPATLTVKQGQTVKIVNQSTTAPLSFNSDPHPTHTNEPELNAGSIDPGASKTVIVTKIGHWGYHNHFDPSQSGTIIVEAK